VEGTLNLFQEHPDVVVVETRSQAEITSVDAKWLRAGRLDRCVQRPAKVLVNEFLKRPPGTPRFAPQLGGNIIVEGERSALHIRMLSYKHHDVYLAPSIPSA